MRSNTNNTNNVIQVYGKVILLAFASHIIFTCMFVYMQIPSLAIYNVFSMFFYVILYFVAKSGHFRSTVTLIHFEISLFVIISCLFLGWNAGFTFYLIALSSLVYFCPFKRKYIPYLFSLMEIIIFLSLKIFSIYFRPLVICNEQNLTALYLFNSILSFATILYAAFISKVSAIITEQTLTQNNTRLQDMVDHDALTHLWSRTYLTDTFEKIQASDYSIIIIMTDVDNFKKINDTYGHECGDYVLSQLADIIRFNCPSNSGVCRWGGEEFVLMFYDTSLTEVTNLIEHIRLEIASYIFEYQGKQFHLTMTFGISSSAEAGNLRDLIRLADDRMYVGKKSGKNVVITPSSDSGSNNLCDYII